MNGLFAIGNMQRPSWTAAGLFRPRSEGGQNKDLRLRRYRRARPLPLRSESNPLLLTACRGKFMPSSEKAGIDFRRAKAMPTGPETRGQRTRLTPNCAGDSACELIGARVGSRYQKAKKRRVKELLHSGTMIHAPFVI